MIHFFNVIGEMSSDLDFNILRVTMSDNVDFKVANQNAKNSLKWPQRVIFREDSNLDAFIVTF